jgi:hypothetical protein
MNRIFSLLYLIIVGLFGWWVSQEINGFLKISFKAKKIEAPIKIPENKSDSLCLRLVDFGGVGILPDTANWGNNYEHNVHRFEDLLLENYPFIKENSFKRIQAQTEIYTQKMGDLGMNGIVLPLFLEFVTFSKHLDQSLIYSQETPYIKRHLALRNAFNSLAEIANSNGLKTYLYTDMVTLTKPLEAYFKKRFGKVDVQQKEFWKIYQAGLEELFENMPNVEGLMIRIGEAGSVYNKPGWDYFSELYVKDKKAVDLMLHQFLQVAERYNKKIIFRSWSVGVGEIGDMHTNPATYQEVLGKQNSPNLIISTKYCNGDYYSWLPFNRTLYQGKQNRIVEFQARREFEGLGALPNYVAPLHQQALVQLNRRNPRIQGMWLWSQEGGPLRAGPLSTYPFYGFNSITDANVYALAQLAQNPNQSIDSITQNWVAEKFGTNPQVKEKVSEVLLASHEAIEKGLYIGNYSKLYVKALGLEPPPMLWIFEWDIVGGSSAALGAIYHVSKGKIKPAIKEGDEAISSTIRMRKELENLAGKVTKNKAEFRKLITAFKYQEQLFKTLGAYRTSFLAYYDWIATGNKASKITGQKALATFKIRAKEHQLKYGKNLDFPAYSFTEAAHGIEILERSTLVSWLALSWLLIFGLQLLRLSRNPDGRLLISSVFAPQSRKIAKAPTRNVRFLVLWLLLALLIFSAFLAPIFTTWLFSLFLIYLLTIRLLLGQHILSIAQRIWPLALLSLSLLLFPMLAVSIRGSISFWLPFWTSENFRTAFFSIWILISAWIYLRLWLEFMRKDNGFQAFGKVLLVQGIMYLVGGACVYFTGLENMLTYLNDELLVLPGGLSRIMGITTHLDIPLELPLWVIYAGGICVFMGLLLNLNFIFKRKTK